MFLDAFQPGIGNNAGNEDFRFGGRPGHVTGPQGGATGQNHAEANIDGRRIVWLTGGLSQRGPDRAIEMQRLAQTKAVAAFRDGAGQAIRRRERQGYAPLLSSFPVHSKPLPAMSRQP